MTDKTAPQRVARHTKKKKKAGYIRVTVWAKTEDRDKILRYAKNLRNKP